jgi:NADPH:quinone reductase-like Zn-dependent oxidoreductase
MRAAVVQSYDSAPIYQQLPEPPCPNGYARIRVQASAISQLSRVQAAGQHYIRPQPPFVPGTDGVGLLDDGQRVYFAFPQAPAGAMSEVTCVDKRYLVKLPEVISSNTAAAMANPAMSSWAALTRQANFVAGQNVIINGATGLSGRLAIQIARRLGANRIIALGRSEHYRDDVLALGANEYWLTHDEQTHDALKSAFDDGVDVVLDYLWGQAAEMIIQAAGGNQKQDGYRRTQLINMGALDGPNTLLAANAIRSTGLTLAGVGIGSLSKQTLIDVIAEVMTAAAVEPFRVDYQSHDLSKVSEVWHQMGFERTVLTM